MAFKTKREKYAYVKGIKKGTNGGKPYGKKKPQKKKDKGMYINGIRENELALRDMREAARKYEREREKNAARMGIKLPF